MRENNRILAQLFEYIAPLVQPGVTTAELDREAENFILSCGAKPAFKGYRGFPATICASINEEVVHGFPGPRQLKEGDILSIDLGALKNGFYSDSARTFAVGQISEKAARLLRVTEESLYAGINMAVPGGRLSDIGHAVQQVVEKAGFSVIRDFVGHGIGRQLHEEPQIPNFGRKGLGPQLKVGMVLAIEPMTAAGSWQIRILEDQWTAVTLDRSLAAHFEHSVAITKDGPLILSAL
ncbi:MAG: Methionine aminopeptidase 1 [Deltaproteobacteria bacterium ADurb.Bin510]|nr:MAG: Methionine aminopeptidase 1 [Deltaproteobacteria bacterium ADurb.Bin510]